MELTLLGTGCPQCDVRRFGPANLVRHAGLSLLVDCGSGVTQRLLATYSSGRDVDAVFLTHLHSDHIVDLFQLVISSWHQGRGRPQRIFGPPGTRSYVDSLMALWRAELEQRIAHEKRASTKALEIDVTEFGEGVIFDEGGVSVRAGEFNHKPVHHAYGFVFAAGGRTLAFSGDTTYWPPLIEAARGADALVHEVFIHRKMNAAEAGRTDEGLRNVAGYHTLSSEVGKVAARARAKCLVLNHFAPVAFDEGALLAEVREDYAGPVVIGEDLMRIDLDSGALDDGGAAVPLASMAGAPGAGKER